MREGLIAYNIAKQIFPICRSITGEGVRQTLEILKKEIFCPDYFSIVEVPTGTKVFDWTVPKEWKIEEAYIEDEDKNIIIDYTNNNLHVVGYSTPVDAWVGLDELKNHIYTQPDQEDVIPYVTSYYKESFGFCMSERQKKSLSEKRYHMVIKSQLFDGALTYGEIKIPGKTEDEIFFSTYICHPSMGNNECSGPSLMTQIINYVYSLTDRRYSYRFVFVPETIGAISYLALDNHLPEMKEHIVAGFNISCVGDDNNYSIIESRYCDTLADKVLLNQLELNENISSFSRYTYLERASDERQYGAPGVELPLVTFCRSKFHSYKEYHTSADDMDFISERGFQGSYDVISSVINSLENNYYYKCSVLCEPQLGKRGLYPTTSQKGTKGDASLMQDILAYSDGHNDLIDLSNKLQVEAEKLMQIISVLIDNGLLYV